jgi:hypothetical protein
MKSTVSLLLTYTDATVSRSAIARDPYLWLHDRSGTLCPESEQCAAEASNVSFDLIVHHSSIAKKRREVLRQIKVLQGSCKISLVPSILLTQFFSELICISDHILNH